MRVPPPTVAAASITNTERPARANVTALYEAQAKVGNNAKNATFAADNVAMVMSDCAADPARVATCAAQARTVPDLERDCLVPVDDDGTEGERFK